MCLYSFISVCVCRCAYVCVRTLEETDEGTCVACYCYLSDLTIDYGDIGHRLQCIYSGIYGRRSLISECCPPLVTSPLLLTVCAQDRIFFITAISDVSCMITCAERQQDSALYSIFDNCVTRCATSDTRGTSGTHIFFLYFCYKCVSVFFISVKTGSRSFAGAPAAQLPGHRTTSRGGRGR